MLWQSQLGYVSGRGALDGAVASGGGAEAAAFLARTSGLDATHTNAYVALIDGLVADAVWSKLDVLHVYATQDTTTAQLNLISSSYPATLNGSPTFTADRGYTGVAASTTVYINTGFNPTTAPSPKYVRNSAHFSLWSVIDVGGQADPAMGASLNGSSCASQIYPKRSTDSLAYFRINDNASSAGVANATPTGHYIANRSAASAVQGYKNGSSILTGTAGSNNLVNAPFFTLAYGLTGGGNKGTAHQQAMASIGSSLDATQATNFYNRLRTYMTAVGVP